MRRGAEHVPKQTNTIARGVARRSPEIGCSAAGLRRVQAAAVIDGCGHQVGVQNGHRCYTVTCDSIINRVMLCTVVLE